MNDPLNIFLMIIILIGIIGTLMPSMPGTGIILAGAIIHALLSDFNPLTWQNLLVLGTICLVGYLGQYLITATASKKMGASKYGVIGACLGMLVGFIVPIPGGIFAGAFVGAVSFEIFFALKDLQEAMKAGAGALLGTLLSLFFELVIGLTMAAFIFYRLFNSSS